MKDVGGPVPRVWGANRRANRWAWSLVGPLALESPGLLCCLYVFLNFVLIVGVVSAKSSPFLANPRQGLESEVRVAFPAAFFLQGVLC